MSDWHCQVVEIEKIEKHPDANNLSVATVLGNYPVIFKTGDYQVGQLVSYICIDSVVPSTAQFHFMSPVSRTEDGQILGFKYPVGLVPERYRIVKAKKIRGIFSMGLLMPAPENFNVGDSIVDFFNLTKCEEEEEEASDPTLKKNKARTQNEKRPEGWNIPYYDISSIRKYLQCISPDEEIVLHEKIHGANGAFCHDGQSLWCKSRNFFKREIIEFTDGDGIPHKVDSTDQWWVIARRLDLKNKLSKYPGVALFGEVYGQVKNFPYDTKVIEGERISHIRFFDAYNTKIMRYLDHDDFVLICQDLDLDMAPQLYRGPWLGKEKMFPYAEGKTTLGGRHIIEGFVIKTVKERFDPQLHSRMILKLVGEGYSLLK